MGEHSFTFFELDCVSFFTLLLKFILKCLATFGVSWLKIKPVVLIFPVIESASADSVTHTTVKSLWREHSFTLFRN